MVICRAKFHSTNGTILLAVIGWAWGISNHIYVQWLQNSCICGLSKTERREAWQCLSAGTLITSTTFAAEPETQSEPRPAAIVKPASRANDASNRAAAAPAAVSAVVPTAVAAAQGGGQGAAAWAVEATQRQSLSEAPSTYRTNGGGPAQTTPLNQQAVTKGGTSQMDPAESRELIRQLNEAARQKLKESRLAAFKKGLDSVAGVAALKGQSANVPVADQQSAPGGAPTDSAGIAAGSVTCTCAGANNAGVVAAEPAEVARGGNAAAAAIDCQTCQRQCRLYDYQNSADYARQNAIAMRGASQRDPRYQVAGRRPNQGPRQPVQRATFLQGMVDKLLYVRSERIFFCDTQVVKEGTALVLEQLKKALGPTQQHPVASLQLENDFKSPVSKKVLLYSDPLQKLVRTYRSRCESKKAIDDKTECQKSFGMCEPSFEDAVSYILSKPANLWIEPIRPNVMFCGGLGKTVDMYNFTQQVDTVTSADIVALLRHVANKGQHPTLQADPQFAKEVIEYYRKISRRSLNRLIELYREDYKTLKMPMPAWVDTLLKDKADEPDDGGGRRLSDRATSGVKSRVRGDSYRRIPSRTPSRTPVAPPSGPRPLHRVQRDVKLNSDLIDRFIVVPEHSTLFCYMEKVACTQFNTLFRNLRQMKRCNVWFLNPPHEHQWNHDTVKDALMDRAWTKAIFYRDPFERLVSAFRSKCIAGFDPDAWSECWKTFGHNASFVTVVTKLVQGKATVARWNPHFRPQRFFCGGLTETYKYYDIKEHLESSTSGTKVTGMLQRIGANPAQIKDFDELFPKAMSETFYKHSHHTNAGDHMLRYYQQVPPAILKQLLEIYLPDYKLFNLAVPAWIDNLLGRGQNGKKSKTEEAMPALPELVGKAADDDASAGWLLGTSDANNPSEEDNSATWPLPAEEDDKWGGPSAGPR